MRHFIVPVVLGMLPWIAVVGCRPADDPPQAKPDSPDVAVSQVVPASSEQSTLAARQTAARQVLQEINGTLKQDASGKTVELNLAGRRWSTEAQVTQILDAFPDVKSLTLEGRELTDALAPVLVGLPNLEALALRETMVGDVTLAALAGKPTEQQKLKILDVRVGANLTDAGIDAVAKIKTLRALRLIGCELTDARLATLTDSLTRLSEIDLRGSRGFTVAAIANLEEENDGSLRTLKLGGVDVTNAMLQPVAAMHHLTSLSLEESEVDDTGIALLHELPLRNLVLLRSLFIGDEGLNVLKDYAQLESLDLQDTGATLAAIGWLPKPEVLTTLDMSQTGIEDADLGKLLPLTNLKRLHLSSTRLTDAAVGTLTKLKSLRLLTVDGADITAEGVEQLRQALPEARIVSN